MARPKTIDAELIRLYHSQGYTNRQIAELTQYNYKSVTNNVTLMGLKPNKASNNQERNAEIILNAEHGYTIAEIAEMTNLSYAIVRRVLKENGVTAKHAKSSRTQAENERDMKVIELLKQGVTERKIQALAGVNAGSIDRIKKQNGLMGINKDNKKNQANKHEPLNIEDVNERCNSKGFEYVGGFENLRSHITIKCKRCNDISVVRFKDHFAPSRLKLKDKYCTKCKQQLKAEQRKEDDKYFDMMQKIISQAEKQEKKIRKHNETVKKNEAVKKEKEKQRKKKMETVRICKCCGEQYKMSETGYNSEKYCSKRCQNRTYQRKHDAIRDYRKHWRKHDSDITLERLYKRDGGKCHICGGQCDWSAGKWQNGAFYTYAKYPTIDHVKPLSKGGYHTWENVKLAHMRCNYLKRDKSEWGDIVEQINT